MKRFKLKQFVVDGLFICVGAFIYAAGIDVLIVPNQLTSGGITGLATQFNYLFDIPVGVLVLLINIPLLILGWIKLGGKFVVSSACATVLSSILIDTLKNWLPVYHGDQLLVAVFGGAASGLGVSLLYLRGSSMGGSDIISTLLNKHYPHLPIGKITLAMNSLVILSSMLVYKNVEVALCSAVGAFVSSKVVDAILIGADSGNILLAVTHKPFEAADAIHSKVGRGATVLPATGTAAGEKKQVLLCVARRNEFAKIKRIIKSIDPQAFIVVSDAREVLGNGFKEIA